MLSYEGNRDIARDKKIKKRKQKERQQFYFIPRKCPIKSMEVGYVRYPVIELIHSETQEVICYAGLERYIIRANEAEDENTLFKKAVSVCKFLNYLLHETYINMINECTVDIIQDFFCYSKKKNEEEEYKVDTWLRNKNNVLRFLECYYMYNKNNLKFGYTSDDLKINKGDKLIRPNYGVKPPKKGKRKKFRFLPYEFLEPLLLEAEKYDPELALAIALQAYAGLREGEVVNLTCGRVDIRTLYMGATKDIILNIETPADYVENWDKKTKLGSVKKNRIQKVYDDFVKKIIVYYEQHIERHEALMVDTSANAPLFVNNYKKPLTVKNYTDRVKKLFLNKFLPKMREKFEEEGTLLEYLPLIEKYEAEYPGAHMFRHWFTMYLYGRAKLDMAEIVEWRGDSSMESMMDYIHINAELIQLYDATSEIFQKGILKYIGDEEKNNEKVD